MILRPGRLGGIYALLAAVVVVALFAVAAFFVRDAIEKNALFQRELRTAQLDRSRLLRLQIDEETGMRGYVVTSARIFLQPYARARLQFPIVAGELERGVVALGIRQTDVADEVAANRTWLREIAEPAIANHAAGSSVALQLRGKSLVDALRVHDSALNDDLNAAADQGQVRVSRLISSILNWTVIASIVLAGIFLSLAYFQQRLGQELEEQRDAYLEEKRVADALQQAFLRKDLPELADANLHGVYVPAGSEAKVGGDWYDAFELKDDRILVSIGDVAGHGIDAAVVMSRVRQAVLSVGIEERDPGKVLVRANEILLLQDHTIVTAVCGTIDLATGAIVISNAGHPAAILLRPDGEIEKLEANGPPLGALDRPSYGSSSTNAEPGSLLVFYTDGLVEYDRDLDAGEARLIDAIRLAKRTAARDPAASIMESIFAGQSPADDVAILTISFRESARQAIHYAVPGLEASVAEVEPVERRS